MSEREYNRFHPAHPDYDPEKVADWYREELEKRRREGPKPWPYDIPQLSAQLFEALAERFTWEDVRQESALPMLRGLVDEEALRGFVADWQAREMVTKAGEAYVKTGHRPYRTDQGLLSKGRGYGSNLDR